MRRILAIALLAALGGCQQVQEYTLTDTEKISRAGQRRSSNSGPLVATHSIQNVRNIAA